MRDLREMSKKRSDRRKGRSFSFFSAGLIFLFLSVAIWVFMDWKDIGEKKVVQTLTPGRMIHSGLEKRVPIPHDEKQPAAVSQDPKIAKNLSLPTVQVSERRGEKSALNLEDLQTSDADHDVSLSSQKQNNSNTEEWMINSLGPSNPKSSSDRKGIDLRPVQDEPTKIYTIQVAAFREKVRADALVEELKDKGYSAYLQLGEIKKGEGWYRVRVGAFQFKEEAMREVENLQGQEALPPYITLMTH